MEGLPRPENRRQPHSATHALHGHHHLFLSKTTAASQAQGRAGREARMGRKHAGSLGADWKLHQMLPFPAIKNVPCSFRRSRGCGLHVGCVGNSVFSPWTELPSLSCSFIKSLTAYQRHISRLTACCRGPKTLQIQTVLCLVFFFLNQIIHRSLPVSCMVHLD